METRDLICINCPMGCQLHIELENGQVISLSGNTCPRGDAYGRSEVEKPIRMITSILPVENGDLPMVSCKTTKPIDKNKIFDIMNALKDVSVQAPIEIGDILVAHPAGSDADIIATRKIQKI